jgi:hypothetical protein
VTYCQPAHFDKAFSMFAKSDAARQAWHDDTDGEFDDPPEPRTPFREWLAAEKEDGPRLSMAFAEWFDEEAFEDIVR